MLLRFLFVSYLNLILFVLLSGSGYVAGYAEENPAQTFMTALACFNNKFIYAGCDEAYRLNESGNFNAPPEATDLICHGPCLAETQQVLNCVDHMLAGFVFNSRSALQILEVHCVLVAATPAKEESSIFLDLFVSIQGETSNAHELPNFSSFFTFLIVTGCSLHLPLNAPSTTFEVETTPHLCGFNVPYEQI